MAAFRLFIVIIVPLIYFYETDEKSLRFLLTMTLFTLNTKFTIDILLQKTRKKSTNSTIEKILFVTCGNAQRMCTCTYTRTILRYKINLFIIIIFRHDRFSEEPYIFTSVKIVTPKKLGIYCIKTIFRPELVYFRRFL